MIADAASASFTLSIPSSGRTSTGATSRLAPLILATAPAKTVATYSGGGSAASSGPAAADLAPPSVQTYPVMATAPGMAMGTKVAIFGGLVLVVGAAILVATRK
jgi:hypothetical protein